MGLRIRSRYSVRTLVRFHDRLVRRRETEETGLGATEKTESERERGASIVAPYTYYGDCLCWLMATYAAHTSHYEAVLDPHEPLVSPWLRRHRVMTNTLRIKCILILSRPYGTDASAPSKLPYPLSFLLTPFSLVLS